jgi:hypothetical protein
MSKRINLCSIRTLAPSLAIAFDIAVAPDGLRVL